MIRAKINNKEVEFENNISILKALQQLEINVPTLCNDERLKPCGACRLCLVKVKGLEHPLVSCENDLTDGLEIETHTPELETARKLNLKMLARKYPLDSFKKFPDKPFHKSSQKIRANGRRFFRRNKSQKN